MHPTHRFVPRRSACACASADQLLCVGSGQKSMCAMELVCVVVCASVCCWCWWGTTHACMRACIGCVCMPTCEERLLHVLPLREGPECCHRKRAKELMAPPRYALNWACVSVCVFFGGRRGGLVRLCSIAACVFVLSSACSWVCVQAGAWCVQAGVSGVRVHGGTLQAFPTCSHAHVAAYVDAIAGSVSGLLTCGRWSWSMGPRA